MDSTTANTLLAIFGSVLTVIAGLIGTILTVFGGQLVAILKFHMLTNMSKLAAKATDQTAPKGASDEYRKQMAQGYLKAFAGYAGITEIPSSVGIPVTEANVNDLRQAEKAISNTNPPLLPILSSPTETITGTLDNSLPPKGKE